MPEPDSSPLPATRNHLLVTPELVLIGTVNGVTGRLAESIRSGYQDLLTVEDVEVQFHIGADSEEFVRVHVPRAQVLFAHEYVDLGGDPHLRESADAELTLDVVLVFPDLSLRGRVARRHLVETTSFLTLRKPEILTADKDAEARISRLRKLPWLLVNRAHIQAIIEDEKTGS